MSDTVIILIALACSIAGTLCGLVAGYDSGRREILIRLRRALEIARVADDPGTSLAREIRDLCREQRFFSFR